MTARLGLPGLANCMISLNTRRKRVGFLVEALRHFGKAFCKRD